MRRRQGIPILVGTKGASQLTRIPFDSKSGAFNEEFLQVLIDQHPECLPIAEIEPGLPQFRSVCREMPTDHGFIDNVLMSASGDIALVETKLWRNVEARREVVAQALDYASCLFEMKYTEFERSALKGVFDGRKRPTRLFELFDSPDGLEESEFVDAVTQNLSRGRLLILIVGDGIRSDAEQLAQGLQSHAGFHFTLGLVELTVYRIPGSDDRLVIPSTLAKTTLVERGIVRVDMGARQVHVEPARSGTSAAATGSISSEQFFEAMAKRNPRLPERLRAFLDALAEVKVYPEYLRALNLRWDGRRTYPLGIIQRDGQVWTDNAGGAAPIELGRRYVEELAAGLGGGVEKNKLGGRWYVTLDGGRPPKIEQIIDRLDAWVRAAKDHIDRLRQYEDANLVE